MTSQCITDGKFSCSADRQNRVAHICAISTNPDKDLTVTGYLQDRNLLPNIYNIQFITKCLQGNDLLLNIYKIRIYLVPCLIHSKLKSRQKPVICFLQIRCLLYKIKIENPLSRVYSWIGCPIRANENQFANEPEGL